MTDANDFPRLDVLAVGAHPDDVEIACGGTLALLARQGYQVGIIDLTDGEPTPRSPGPEVRLAEAAEAARVLGVHRRVTLPLQSAPVRFVRSAGSCWRRSFVDSVRVVIGFGDKTPLASPDHWQAMQITDAAVFYARLSKWDEHFDGLPVHNIDVQLYFRLAFEPATLGGYASHFTVDISDTLNAKLASVACYKTQFPPEKAYVFERIRGARLHRRRRQRASRPARSLSARVPSARTDPWTSSSERRIVNVQCVPHACRMTKE